MAPDSSTLAWKIPWMKEPGRLQSMGSLRVGCAFSLILFSVFGVKFMFITFTSTAKNVLFLFTQLLNLDRKGKNCTSYFFPRL